MSRVINTLVAESPLIIRIKPYRLCLGCGRYQTYHQFPDVRNKCLIHANTGTCLFIPREDDKVRLYVQMAEIPLSVGGRVDKTGMGPEKILEVCFSCRLCVLEAYSDPL